jgi:hypothetical protein
MELRRLIIQKRESVNLALLELSEKADNSLQMALVFVGLANSRKL